MVEVFACPSSSPGASQQSNSCKVCHHPRCPKGTKSISTQSLAKLRETSGNGCATCQIFLEAIQKLADEENHTFNSPERSMIGFWYQTSYLGENLVVVVLEFPWLISFFASKYTPWLRETLPDLPLGLPVPRSTSSDESVQWAKDQLDHCTASHICCQSANDVESKRMPRRVLDIGASQKDAVRLIIGPTITEPYACLSYCWGKEPFLSTNKGNLGRHRQQVDWLLLPRTFQDAIAFLRKLGIRYLWVDSLCIIQDDPDDWRRESSNMASIYQNAHLVICATKNTKANDSLFTDVGDRHRIHALSIKTSDGQEEEICYRRGLTHVTGALSTGKTLRDMRPTLSRGWIFQERMLAVRVLHFGPEELFWECLGHSVCQCTRVPEDCEPSSTILSLPDGSVNTRFDERKSLINLKNISQWTGEMRTRCWQKLVEEYSRLQLTYESDLFPALSGITNVFASTYGSKPLAGIWEGEVEKGLLWHSASGGDTSAETFRRCGRPAKWRAPTWSWASVTRQVAFINTSAGFESCCFVEKAYCQPLVESHREGEITNAFLVLKGRLILTTLHYGDVEIVAMMPWNAFRLGITQNRVSNTLADIDVTQEGKDHVPDGSEVYCFPVGIKTMSGAIECLILKKVSEDEEIPDGTFERIGLLELPRAPNVGFDEWVTPSRQNHLIKLI